MSHDPAFAADLAYLVYFGSGIFRVLLIQLVLGSFVWLLGSLFPDPRWRSFRLATGGAAVAAAVSVGRQVFDPKYSVMGAAGAATLLVFNTPLRCIQFLATPISSPVRIQPSSEVAPVQSEPTSSSSSLDYASPRDDKSCNNVHCSGVAENANARKPATLAPFTVVVLLCLIPACPLLPQLSIHPDTTPTRVKPVPALPSLIRALSYFGLVAAASMVVPVRVAGTFFFAAPLITTSTAGFAHVSASLFSLASGVKISAPFSHPWLSPTLASFWAWRWNSPIASALRSGVVDPLLVYAGAHPAVATLAAFAFSGVAHATILAFAGFQVGVMRWFWFFMIHGIAVCIEREIKARKILHPRFERLLVAVFSVATAELLFFGPLYEDPQFEPVLRELGTGARVLVNIGRMLLGLKQTT